MNVQGKIGICNKNCSILICVNYIILCLGVGVLPSMYYDILCTYLLYLI